MQSSAKVNDFLCSSFLQAPKFIQMKLADSPMALNKFNFSALDQNSFNAEKFIFFMDSLNFICATVDEIFSNKFDKEKSKNR